MQLTYLLVHPLLCGDEATWGLPSNMVSRLGTDETLIIVPSFQIANAILGAHEYVPHFPLV